MATNRPRISKSFTIHDMAPSDRPRERLMKYGVEDLPVIELLAVLLGRGIAGESVMVTAQRLMNHFKSLNAMSEASLEQLMQVRGIGLAKACQIQAAFQLAKRKRERKVIGYGDAIKNPKDAEIVVRSHFKDKTKEHFWAVLLNTRGRLIKTQLISKGSLDSSIVHPREVFNAAITESAASVIFLHNHPSGIADPSEDDIRLTKRLVDVGELMGIEVLDHIIIGSDEPFSMKRHGLL